MAIIWALLLVHQLEEDIATSFYTDSKSAIDIITRATSKSDPISILAISTYNAVQIRRHVPIRHTKARVGQPWNELCDSIAKHHTKKYQNTDGIINVDDDC